MRRREGAGSFAAHVRALDRLAIPIYQWRRWAEITRSVVYPKATVERLVSHGGYHCGSFDWMMALAIQEGTIQDIHLYGVDLGPLDGEPLSARTALEYWIGVAEGRGMRVTVHPPTSLFATYQLIHSHRQYGYDNVDNVRYE